MSSWLWNSYLFVFFLLPEYNGCLGCLSEERNALLQIKATIAPQSKALATWVDDKTSDCCSWGLLNCNNTTGRVMELYLNGIFIHGTGVSLLNASQFLSFKELQLFDLSNNYIDGWYRNEGFERFSEMKNLKVLSLRNNYLNTSVLRSLGAITSLTTLNLGGNRLDIGPSLESFPVLGRLSKLEVLELNGNSMSNRILSFLDGMTSLKTLNLRSNYLTGSLSKYSRVFTNMRHLEILDLSLNSLNDFLPLNDLRNMSNLKVLKLVQNNFSGTIPPSILSISSLEALSLQNNNLEDTLSGFCKLKNLQELVLTENKFEGMLPPCLNNLTSLRMIDFSSNQLRGTISSSLISNLKSLQYISLRSNPFNTTIAFSSFIDHKFQLQFLDLSDCSLKVSTSNLLNFLHDQYDLRHVDISNNNFHGEFPSWLVENNTRLETFIVRNNSLNGHVHFPLKFGSKLVSIDLSNNHFHGQLQTNIGDALTELRYFDVSKNRLEGTIPSSLGSIKNLKFLDLSSNNLSGELSERLALGCTLLEVLILSHNRLHSQIPPTFFNLTYMKILRLNDNEFTGNIPYGKIVPGLLTLDISNNHISGRIPTWIADPTRLFYLALRGNAFDGPIPTEFCSLYTVEYLDLSHNHLSGDIPSCLVRLRHLKFLHLQGNEFMGSIPKDITRGRRDSELLTLDLAGNKLTGSIPSEINSLSNLLVLQLKGNRLSGLVPRQLCHLYYIGIMDLSNNVLSGSIPSCFNNITFGKQRAFELVNENDLGYPLTTYEYTSLLGDVYSSYIGFLYKYTKDEEVEFMSKSYKGDILASMSGLDMSRNYLTSSIPAAIGALTAIKALDFSYNQLAGQIPNALSNMTQLQSMDLSHNKLRGRIPSGLNQIQTLTVFTVAYNNLSGRIPTDRRFGEGSYLGNPFLCGPPLSKSCK